MATQASTLGFRPTKTLPVTQRLAVTDMLLAVTIVWSVLPETLVGEIYLYDIPLRFCLFYLTVLSCLLSTMFFGASRVSLNLAVALAALPIIAGLGLWNGNDWKFWVIDLSNYSGLLLGLYWGGRYSLQTSLNSLYKWTVAVGVLMLFNILGLLFGIVPQAGEGERLYSYSMFTSASFLTCMFPLWFSGRAIEKKLVIPTRAQLLSLICICCVLFASMLSATRSMFLSGTTAIVIVMWLRLRGKNAVLMILLTLVVSCVFAVYAFSTDGWMNHRFADRLTSTDITEEYRYTELQMMFEDLQGSLLTGKGFGSRFESCIGKNHEFLAFAPHVSIFTLLYKGGIVSFALLIALPLAVSATHLLRVNDRAVSLSFSAAVVLYCIQASMSGGWNFIQLFLFGAALTLASRCSTSKHKNTRFTPKQ